MSREIKFRAWVTEGLFVVHNQPYMATQGEPDIETLQSFMHHYSDEKNLMQYIGLKDKNKKEIYEGDILSDSKGGYGVVEYRQPQFVVWADDKHWALAEGKINMDKLEYTEVIGNIYENPELLNP